MKSTDKTVFVRFVGDDDAGGVRVQQVTRFHLEEHFSNYGPIKKCSLIHKKGGSSSTAVDDTTNTKQQQQSSSLGYGFVKYVTQEDAKRALSQNNKYMTVNNNNNNGKEQKYKLIVELASTSTTKKNEKKKEEAALLQDKKENKRMTTAHPQEEETTITTTTATPVVQQPQEQHHDYLIQQSKQRKKRTNRVIVRNLAFSANETHIRQTLENEFGPIVDITLPRVSPKLHRGFCFVTFQNIHDAQRAIQPRGRQDSNPIRIKNRPVAIDLSMPKIVHQRIIRKEQQEEEEEEQQQEEETDETEEKHCNEKNHEKESSSGDDDDDSSRSDDQEDDDDDSSSSDDQEDSDDDSDKEVEEDDSEEAEKETTTTVTTDEHNRKQAKDEHDHVDDAVSKRCTLFLRNLPFDATRHDVFELFVKFGYITGIYLVKDKATGVARGTAFVSFTKPASAQRALQAAGGEHHGDAGAFFVTQRDVGNNKNDTTTSTSSGLYLRGRHILVDLAVDKGTAMTLTAEKQQEQTRGKDRRNLYLKTEGRVANQADLGGSKNNNNNNSAWEHLPESDQLKRQRAFADKNTKLRSPLFFINPHRLSLRNLAKHVDEASLKRLCVMAVTRGLKHKLVTQDDQVAHWRASGDNMSTRDIMQRINEAKKEDGNNNSVIPDFDEGNVKQFIPSVYIDRDMTTTTSHKKDKAPSRGFGFVEFQHHVHALACLRELNNNPFYSAEYVTGGKKAADMKKSSKNRKKSHRSAGEPNSNEFVGDDGRVRIPRLIVEFTVENKAKAKKQAEHRAQQQANAEKQRLEHKEKKQQEEKGGKKKQKKSRGAVQRERKRQQQHLESAETTQSAQVAEKDTRDQQDVGHPQKRVKSVKPPKKKRKVDKEEQNFDKMVQSYKAAFAGVSNRTREAASTVEQKPDRAEATKKRWFE